MRGHWTRARRLTSCTSLTCQRSMVRDEAVYLVAGQERNIVCAPCAQRRFDQAPPADLPHLPPIIDTPPPASRPVTRDAVEPRGAFQRFAEAQLRGDTRKLITKVRRETTAAAAIDPKLKQLGGDQ